MKKILLVAAITVVGFISANAQEASGFRFGAGASLGLPIGDWSDYWSFGVGGEVQGEYLFSEKVALVVNSGFTSFIGKTVDSDFGEVKMQAVGEIPILAGVRVYPSTQFFIGARAGLGIFTGRGESSSVFQYRPEIGYNGSPFQFALGYNGLTKDGDSNNFLGLTILYIFSQSGK